MTTAHTLGQFWHWPDHIIYKRESRRLREEHNALGNSHAELLEACKRMLEAYAPARDESDRLHLHPAVIAAIDAIAHAEGKAV